MTTSENYTVNLTRSAQKEIRALDGIMRVRVVQSIRRRALEPRPLVAASLQARSTAGEFELAIIELSTQSTTTTLQ